GRPGPLRDQRRHGHRHGGAHRRPGDGHLAPFRLRSPQGPAGTGEPVSDRRAGAGTEAAPRRPGAGVPGAAPGGGRGRLTWPSRRDANSAPAVTSAMPTTATGCTSSPRKTAPRIRATTGMQFVMNDAPVAPTRPVRLLIRTKARSVAATAAARVASRGNTANSDPPTPTRP